jgi:hypothetical protein
MIRALLRLPSIHILVVAPSNSCKTTFLEIFVRTYFLDAGDTNNNVLNINSLKDQGIGYYRSELKTFCQTYCSVPGRKKMVIIDDLDFVNEQCQQVFRNYIDHYGNDVHFVSSCSNVQKVVESMQSRLLFVRLPPILPTHLETSMYQICITEKLYLEPEARKYLIGLSSSSYRCMLNYLEKMKIIAGPQQRSLHLLPPSSCSCGDNGDNGDNHNNHNNHNSRSLRVSLAFCENICTDVHPQLFHTYIVCIKENRLARAIKILFSLHDKGFSVLDVLDNLFAYLKSPHSSDVMNETQKYMLVPVLCKFIHVFHTVHEDKLELAFFSNHCLRAFCAANSTCLS